MNFENGLVSIDGAYHMGGGVTFKPGNMDPEYITDAPLEIKLSLEPNTWQEYLQITELPSILLETAHHSFGGTERIFFLVDPSESVQSVHIGSLREANLR